MFLVTVLSALVLIGSAQYSSDQCNWTGSGLTHESHTRDVEQVYLRCAEGSLEWLYPTGAIIVNLRPNLQTSAGHGERLHACIKPHVDSQGAALYVERAGELRPLLSEAEQAAGHVRCFSLQEGALFVEATAQRDISKRITAFQYQLISTQMTGNELYSPTASCKRCSDEEVLMDLCTSDFAVRGSIQRIEEEDEDQITAVVSLSDMYRQKSRVFVSGGGGRGRGRWTGRVKIPQRCGPRAGQGEFLLTGAVRFGEAWVGCSPHYEDFLKLYRSALESGTNPCHIDMD
ncbi:meteorin-like protein [Triplophysa rosa]|uniref:Meteorin-like protein n=1 Tax=Triplophysa rosa TaxID=992332 RepID=A0A9W8C8W5_TRIRA|nr:meteorin-like protein [Triplophysa rosa]KAI7811315.1 putative meteorin-like protein [Triplophysa rosa]